MIHIEIEKFNGSIATHVEDVVIGESKYNLFINGGKEFVFTCLNKQLEEMIYGYLVSKGLIKDVNNVKSIEFIDSDIYIEVENFEQNINKREELSFPPLVIYELFESFMDNSKLHSKTGAVHSMAIADSNEVIIQIDDLSRHTAVDKVFGYCLMNNINLNNKILLSTCRITESIAKKVAATSISCVVSKAAVTKQAIQICNEQQILLIGFVKKNSFNVYTFPERIN